MRRILVLAAIVVCAFGASFAARARLDRPRPQPARRGRPARIVSMAPSITETLYALGLGERVVGVTRFCSYPPEAREKPSVGGLFDPNFEALVALQPDLVVTLVEQEESMPALSRLGMPTLSVCHQNIDGIVDSIPAIGRACGAQRAADELVSSIRARLGRIRQKTAGLQRPRVLVVVDRTRGAGSIENAWVAGRDGHLDRIVALAGGRNALENTVVRFPVISAEGILGIDPDVIVDLVSQGPGGLDPERVRADWRKLGRLRAVRNDRVYVIADPRAAIPGPSFVDLAERLARLLHPDADWQ